MTLKQIPFKTRYQEKLNKIRQKKLMCKFLNNPQADEMIKEQFAKLTNLNEHQISPFTNLTRQQLINHFYSFGHSKSQILETVADYLINIIPKLAYSNFHKFLTEGLLSTSIEVQRQICFSIYSGFRSKLFISNVYDYIEDPICQIILEDLLVLYEASIKSFNNDIQPSRHKSLLKVLEERKNYQYLFVEAPESLESFTDDKEARTVINKNDTYITFTQFLKLSFPDNIPTLLLLIIQLVCGKDLADFYSEVINIRQFKYTLIKRNNRSEYFIDRKASSATEGKIKRENKQLVRKIKSKKPSASRVVIDVSIKLFQALRGSTQIIRRESFINNSVMLRVRVEIDIWRGVKRVCWKII